MVERDNAGRITVKFLNPVLSISEAINLAAWLIFHAKCMGYSGDDFDSIIREIRVKYFAASCASIGIDTPSLFDDNAASEK